MTKNLIFNALFGSLAVVAGASLVGCGPEETKPATVAAAKSVGHEECTDEVVTLTREPKDKKQIAGTAAGAVIGGVLGNKIGGKGDSQKVATAAGAIAGGYAGNKIQENAQENNTYQETKRTCRMVYN
ncbi:MAG: glycine zipper 2TM domain-containing protein [Steroidobacteraceae bacterium]